jgi:hypothetical protein
MRVFKLSDGTSWIAKIHEANDGMAQPATGWDTILFHQDHDLFGQRLVYRPRGWLSSASSAELAAALDEGVAIRVRWGD